MRSVPLLAVALLLSGCAIPGGDGDGGDDPSVDIQPIPWIEDHPAQRPVGSLEVRWPGGEWAPSLAVDDVVVVNATDTVTELPAGPTARTVEVRFVGDLGHPSWEVYHEAAENGTGAGSETTTLGQVPWQARWVLWNARDGEARTVADPTEPTAFPVGAGTTQVWLEFEDPRRGELWGVGGATVTVSRAWEVHGTVQPVPAQAPDAPPVRQEVRVPVVVPYGSLTLATEAVGDAPVTGRDLRLGYVSQHDEGCVEPPAPGVMDHTSHLLQAPVWDPVAVVQVYVGNPYGYCSGTTEGPVNAEPIDYVLRVSFSTDDAYYGGFYY